MKAVPDGQAVEAEALKNSVSDDPAVRHILAVEMGAVAWDFCPARADHRHSWRVRTNDMTSFGFVVVCSACAWVAQAKVIEGPWPVLWRPKHWLGRMKRDYRRIKRAGIWQFCPRRGGAQRVGWPALGNHIYRLPSDTSKPTTPGREGTIRPDDPASPVGAICEYCGQRVPIEIYNHPWRQVKVRAMVGVPE